jgi:hypothetical protein
MSIEVRALRGDDIFPILGILGKLGVKDEITSIFQIVQDAQKNKTGDDNGEAIAADVGIKIMSSILDKLIAGLPKVQTEINAFLANVSELTVKDVKALALREYIELLAAVFTSEDVVNFTGSLLDKLSRNPVNT